MQMTALIIEFLIGGILVLLALVFLVVSLFPGEMQTLFNQLSQSQSSLTSTPMLTIIFTAIAYAVGIIMEFIGLATFEWLLNKTKTVRLTQYIEDNQTSIKNSPILKEYADAPQRGIRVTEEKAKMCMGDMRFHILMKNPTLYEEIRSQINRGRLLRVLFLVEFILLAAILIQLVKGYSSVWLYLLIVFLLTDLSLAAAIVARPMSRSGRSWVIDVLAPWGLVVLAWLLIYLMEECPVVLRCWLAVVFAATVANIAAVRSRFDRYCRAIERSYKVLVLDQEAKGDNIKEGT